MSITVGQLINVLQTQNKDEVVAISVFGNIDNISEWVIENGEYCITCDVNEVNTEDNPIILFGRAWRANEVVE